MVVFDLIRSGETESYIDGAGLHDDGSEQATLVTDENVVTYEETFRRKWSWLCPGLARSEVEKFDISTLFNTCLSIYFFDLLLYLVNKRML